MREVFVTRDNDDRYYNQAIPTSVEGYEQDQNNKRLWHMKRPPCIHLKESICKVCPKGPAIKKAFCLLKDTDKKLGCLTCEKRVSP